jgi:hypothetical protein
MTWTWFNLRVHQRMQIGEAKGKCASQLLTGGDPQFPATRMQEVPAGKDGGWSWGLLRTRSHDTKFVTSTTSNSCTCLPQRPVGASQHKGNNALEGHKR